MPKAKPVSLWPLSFEEAITAIIRANPPLKPESKKIQKKHKSRAK
ncbi:MAG: hypothetical protein ABTQ25_02395 [Nitrosomonas ureae]